VPNWYLWAVKHAKRFHGVTKPQQFKFSLVPGETSRKVQLEVKSNMLPQTPFDDPIILDTKSTPQLDELFLCAPKHMTKKIETLTDMVKVFTQLGKFTEDEQLSWNNIIEEMTALVNDQCTECAHFRNIQYKNRANKNDNAQVKSAKDKAYKKAYAGLNNHLMESKLHKIENVEVIWPFIPEEKKGASGISEEEVKQSVIDEEQPEEPEPDDVPNSLIQEPEVSLTDEKVSQNDNKSQSILQDDPVALVSTGPSAKKARYSLEVGHFVIFPRGLEEGMEADSSDDDLTLDDRDSNKKDFAFWVGELIEYNKNNIGNELTVHWYGNIDFDVLKEMFPGWIDQRDKAMVFSKRNSGKPHQQTVNIKSVIMWFKPLDLFTRTRKRTGPQGPTNKLQKRSIKKILDRLEAYEKISKEVADGLRNRLNNKNRK
jgi:hypothetical protein